MIALDAGGTVGSGYENAGGDDGGGSDPAGQDQQGGDPITSAVNSALGTVGDLFEFGRQKFGLGSTQGQGGNEPMEATWGQMPNTSGIPTPQQQTPITGTNSSGSIQPFAVHDDDSDKGYSNPTVTGLPPPQVQSAEGGGRISGLAHGGKVISSYADGGQVDDEGGEDIAQAAQQDQSPVQTDQSQSQGQPQDQTGGSPVQGAQGAGAGGGKRAIGYITGQGAAPSQMMQQLEQQVDPKGQLSPEIRKLLAVHAAAQQGPEAGWAAMQNYRQKFLMLNGVAAAQLKGTQQRPANPVLAAKTATDAYSNSMTGNKVTFSPHPQGLVANVQPYRRPTQGMAAGGVIQSFDDGGSVDGSSTEDLPGAVPKYNSPSSGPTLANGMPIPQPGATPQANTTDPDGTGNYAEPSEGGASPVPSSTSQSTSQPEIPGGPGGSTPKMGLNLPPGSDAQKIANFFLPHDAAVKLLTDASTHDKLNELGESKVMQDAAGGQQQQPQSPGAQNASAPPSAPNATEGAPAPTAQQPNATKGGAAEQPAAKENDIGKLITLPDGTQVYENLWKLAGHRFGWASEQPEKMAYYDQLRKEHIGGEEKVAAAELKGTTAASLVDRRMAQSDINNRRTNDVNASSRATNAGIRQQQADTALARLIQEAKSRGDSNKARLLSAGVGNMGLLDPELQKEVKAGMLDMIHGQQDQEEGNQPAAPVKRVQAPTSVPGGPQANGPQAPSPGTPQRPPNVPLGSAYSAQRQQWKAPDGKLYDASGNPAGR